MKRFFLTFIVAALASYSMQAGGILPSSFAGTWYSEDPKELTNSLDKMLDTAKPDFNGVPIALIQPHAGYAYSAKTMSYGYSLLKGSNVKRVVILGPSHRAFLKGRICVAEGTAMSTPLGTTPIDTEFVAKLRENPFVVADDKIQLKEHSVQMQLPMLQRALQDFKVVPIVTGALTADDKDAVAKALLKLCDSSTVIVVSSDFTHYGASYNYVPFDNDIGDNLKKLDMGAFKKIRRLDPAAFSEYLKDTGDTICGETGIGILLRMMPEDASVSMLHYERSGDQTGDLSNSVSYLSIAFGGKWPEARQAEAVKADNPAPVEKEAVKYAEPSAETEEMLTPADKEALLKIARKSLRHGLFMGKFTKSDDYGVEVSPAVRKHMGAFVTLKKEGRLRGCIGEIQPTRPLYEVVAERAVDAALNDPRFQRVSVFELMNIEIEISVLTPPKKVRSYKDIAVGRHGVILSKDGDSAVFLPQVAKEQGWSREEMLENLSLKAGLSKDAWKARDASFSVFEALVFKEQP